MQVENISKGDIGIVTPYKRQEMEIHSRLVNLDLNSRRNKFRNGKSEGIEVGSVEKFQGNEKKVIIIIPVIETLKKSVRNKKLIVFSTYRGVVSVGAEGAAAPTDFLDCYFCTHFLLKTISILTV